MAVNRRVASSNLARGATFLHFPTDHTDHLMSGSLNLLGESKGSVEPKRGPGLVALLSIAGLIAGLLTVGLVYPVGRLSVRHTQLAWYILGGLFGTTLAISLVTCGVLHGLTGFGKAISLVALSIGAYFVSFWVAEDIELTLHRGGLDRGSEISSLALFAVVLTGAL